MVDSVNIFPKHLLRIGYPAVLLPLLLLFCAACTCSDEQKSEDTPAIKKSTEESTRESKSTPEYIHAALQVVTLSGEALSGMLPIATLQPNAFDAPIATGKPTDTTGKSSLRFPIDQKTALRAWDPDLLYFPNNFYEVLPQSGIIEKTLVISMVKSASIDAVLIGPDGMPIQHDDAGIILFHPVHGPWWPAEGSCDEKGAVTFYHIPPGSYVLRIKVASGPMLELPETYIAPDAMTHLGAIHLQ